MTDATPYIVPKQPGRWQAITLAALVHIALLAFLWIGVHWQSETPATLEAEVWSPQPREAAPRAEPREASQPSSPPVIKHPPTPERVEPHPTKPFEKPDIALEKEKKRKALEEKKREDEERRVNALKEKKKLEDERLAELKLKQKQQLQQQQQLAEQKKLDKEKAEKEVTAKKAAEEKKRKQEEADSQLRAKAREEEMRRITGGATGSGGNGDAARSQGGRTDGSYAQKAAAKIKSNISFNLSEGLEGNPAVEFEVNLLPDGSIASIHKRKSSGVPGFDEAVARAIDKSQPFPKDKSGSVPSSFIGIHKPKDQ